MSATSSYSLADTNIHSLYDLIIAQSSIEGGNTFPINTFTKAPAADFTEVILTPDGANGGTIAVGINSTTLDIAAKKYAVLLASTSVPYVIRRTWKGQRISAKEITLKASAATQVIHITALF